MNKNKYALFFDIDGTLVSFKTHQIPPSTIFALTQAKANGHRVYIATGRPITIIHNLGAIEHLIDGYITTNGAFCFVGDEEVCCIPIAQHDVELILNDAKEKDYPCIISSETKFVVFNPKECVERIFCHELAVSNLCIDAPWQPALEERILQFSPFFSAEYEKEFLKMVPGCVSGRWHPEFTDVTARGADKGRALQLMAAHEGFGPEFTVAFGDGGNDLTMIQKAGVGIAMGNAVEVLKSDAGYITSTVDENGILNALKYLHII